MFISIIVGFLLIFASSNLIFKKLNFENLLVTLFFLVSPVSILAYSHATIIKFYLYGILIFVSLIYICKFYFLNKNKQFRIKNLVLKIKDLCFKKIINQWFIISFTFLTTFALTYKTLPNIWIFDAHDVLYYSWLNEIFRADYFGPIRIPTAYPNIFSAYHFMAGSLLTPFLLFNKNVNMYSTYSIKYILTFLSIFNFLFIYFRSLNLKFSSKIIIKAISPIFVILSLFLFYNSEIDYSFAVTNYPLVLIILTFGSLIIKENANFLNYKKNEFYLMIISLAYCFLITKATTFPIILISYIIFMLTSNISKIKKFFNNVNKKYILFLCFLILINFLSWIIQESNHGSLQASSPLCLIGRSDPKDFLQCTYHFFNNPFQGWHVDSFKINFLDINSSLILFKDFYFIWFVCILPCFFSGILLNKYSNSRINKLFGKYVIVYSLATSFGIVFIRESKYLTGMHTFHSSVIAPVFTLISIIVIYREFIKNIGSNLITNIILSFVIFFNFLINFNDNSIFSSRLLINQNPNKLAFPSITTITNYQSMQFDNNACTKDKSLIKKFGNFLDNKGCASKDNNILEIKAALEGRRTDVSLESKHSIIKQWVLNTK